MNLTSDHRLVFRKLKQDALRACNTRQVTLIRKIMDEHESYNVRMMALMNLRLLYPTHSLTRRLIQNLRLKYVDRMADENHLIDNSVKKRS